jgi:hypothetical protein
MKRRTTGSRQQEALFPKERPTPMKAESTRELVRALADLMLEALGHGVQKEVVDESEDHA